MAIQYVQKSSVAVASGANTVTPELTGVTAGNLLVLIVGTRTTDNPLNMTPPSGWSDAVSPNSETNAGVGYHAGSAIFYKENASAGTHNGAVTVSTANQGYARAVIIEFSGAATTSALDVQTSNVESTTTSTTGTTGTTGTTALADSVALAILVPSSGSGISGMSAPPATSYTTIFTSADDSTDLAVTAGYKILTGTGTQSASCTTTQSVYWANAIAVFKGTEGGGDTNITAGAGALTASGQAPSPTLQWYRNPGVGELTAAGHAPTFIERGTRYAYPTADVSDGTWLPSTGTDLYAAIDEDPASDTDYIYTNAAGACEIRLLPVTDPASSSGYALNYRIWSPVGGNAVVRLKQGATTIATWTHTGLPTTATDYSQALSGAEADSITDHDDLRIEIEAT